MELNLRRSPSLQGATIGELSLGSQFFCYTLEDQVREVEGQSVSAWKIPGQTAIPRGVYRVTVTHSNHFGRDLPLLNAVPGYDGVRIHPGNSAKDTEGCILVGMETEGNLIYKSKIAFARLFEIIQRALVQGEEIYLTVE